MLDKGSATPAQVLAGFSESPENQLAVGAAIQSGIRFFENGVAYVPVAYAGAAMTVEPGTVVTLDGSQSSGMPGKALSYVWTLAAPPGSNAVLAQANTARPSFVPDVRGQFEVSLTVNDGTATSAVSKVVITAGTVPANPAVFSYTDIVVGTGAVAKVGTRATVAYTGWLYSATAAGNKGAILDSGTLSFVPGSGQMILGFDLGVQGMKVGGKRTVLIPDTMGYGAAGRPGVPPGAGLVFDIELLSVP